MSALTSACVLALLSVNALATPTTVTLISVAVATLSAENGDAASGIDDGFFVGVNGNTGGFVGRHGLIQFDLTGIPADAVLQSVSLTLNVARTVHAGDATRLRASSRCRCWCWTMASS
jgi:hypothetical protein